MLGVFFSDFVTANILQGVIVVGLVGASNLTRWFVLVFFWSETSDFFCNFFKSFDNATNFDDASLVLYLFVYYYYIFLQIDIWYF